MYLRLTLATIVLALLTAGMALGQIPITNAGFEADTLIDGEFLTGAFAAGWTTTGQAGPFNPDTSHYTAEAPEGSNIAYSNGPDICQTVETVGNNETYEASAMAGLRLDLAANTPTCGIELRSTSGVRCRGEVSPPPVDGFTVINCNFTADPSDVDDGQPLELCFTSSGSQCNFDTVAAIPVELQSFSIE